MKIAKLKWFTFLIALAVTLTIVFQMPIVFAQGNFCFQGSGCRGLNEVCETETCVDFFGKSETKFISCRPSGLTSAVCPDGTPVTCANICEEGIGGATVKQCNVNAQCRAKQATKPTVILLFSTILKKNVLINITPARVVLPEPQEVSFVVTAKNPNSIDLTFSVQALVPEGWRATFPPQIALRSGETRTFSLVVVPKVNGTLVTETVRLSNGTTATFTFVNITGVFPITIGMFNQQFKILGTAGAKYEILPPHFPNITVSPLSFLGPPGTEAIFRIAVANRDPAGFPPTLFVFSALAPFGWRTTLSDSSLLVNAGQTATATLTVTSNSTADEGAHPVILSARSTTADIPLFVTYSVTLCGDGVCQIGEEQSCKLDCPASPFRCLGKNGRCEIEIDYGVDFNASLTQTFTGYYVCARNASIAQCREGFEINDCGFDRSCLCGNIKGTSCQTRCVDGKGVYYLAADTAAQTIKSANYSFACPFVNLPELIQIRENITESRINFEKGKDVLDERIRRASTAEERGQFLACADALGIAIKNLTSYGQHLDAVIDFPGKKNTTQARKLNIITKNFVSTMFNTYCRATLAGALRIQNISVPQSVELGKQIGATVGVRNTGNIDYFGYAECDFSDPQENKASARSACAPIKQGEQKSLALSTNASAEGRWSLQCRVVGSLQSDCSSEVHDESQPLTFDVYSNEIFVANVQGEIISNDIICTVETSREANCVGCRIDSECARIGSQGRATAFKCPLKPGTHNVTGYVFDSPTCIAVEPKSKSATVRVPGCGDGFVDSNEACDPQNTGEQCKQTSFECKDKKYGTRAEQGICTASCTCQQQQFVFSCVKDQCNAECSDGEQQVREIEKDGKIFKCTQRCTSSCEWGECRAPGLVFDPQTGESAVKSSIQFDPIRASGTANPGTAIDYSAILRNIGDEEDTYSFRIESGNAAIIINTENKTAVSLKQNESADVILKVTPLAKTPGEKDILNISIESQKTGERKSELFTTIISDIANRPPIIKSVSHAPDMVEAGELISFSASLSDPNGDAITDALVCADIECASVLCRLVQREEFTCSYSTINSGFQEYYVFAKDSRDGFSVSDVRVFKVEKAEIKPVEPSKVTAAPPAPEGINPFFVAGLITAIVVIVVVLWVKKESILERFGI